MGKAEGRTENWHGHVTALTVAPDYRRLGLAAKLMKYLEDISERSVQKIVIYSKCLHGNYNRLVFFLQQPFYYNNFANPNYFLTLLKKPF